MAKQVITAEMSAAEQIALSQSNKAKHEASLKRRRIISNIIVYILLAVMCIIWLLPIAWLVLASFNADGLAGMTQLVPQSWGIYNYQDLFMNQVYDVGTKQLLPSSFVFFLRVKPNGAVTLGSIIYTFIIAVLTSLISTLFVMATSYAFSRLRFKSRAAMMRIILLLGMFPGFLGIIVLYQIFNMWKMLNSIWTLVIIYSGGAGMGYYISKGFFDTISKQIDEAAMIDGATRFQIFYKITLPLAKPIIVYQILTSFMGPWAEFITSSYILGSPKNYNLGQVVTVAPQLNDMLSLDDGGMRAKYWGQFCAGAVIVAIPTSILFLILQRNYVGGVTGGAVKG